MCFIYVNVSKNIELLIFTLLSYLTPQDFMLFIETLLTNLRLAPVFENSLTIFLMFFFKSFSYNIYSLSNCTVLPNYLGQYWIIKHTQQELFMGTGETSYSCCYKKIVCKRNCIPKFHQYTVSQMTRQETCFDVIVAT